MERDVFIEALTPRVLSVDELTGLPTDPDGNSPVWVETRIVTDHGEWTFLEASLLRCMDKGLWRRFGAIHLHWEDRRRRKYNVSWRVWSSCPTDAQREAAKWDDQTRETA